MASEMKASQDLVEEQQQHNAFDPTPLKEDIAVHTDTFEISHAALGEDLPKNYYLNWRFIAIVIGCSIANNSYIMPYILSANSIPVIVADLGPGQVIWISLGYTLATSVCLLLFGRLADIFGRRYFVIGGNAIALIGGIVSATAQNVNTVTAGMVLKGLGSGVQQSFPVILAELIPKKYRVMSIALVYGSSVAGYALAPVIASSLLVSTNGNWRYIYYIAIIMDGVIVCIFTLCYHPPPFNLLHVHRSRWQQLKRLDVGGAILFTVGLLLFLMGLSWGGSAYPWKSAHVLATLVVGFCTLVAFVIYELFYKGDQILPTHLFKALGFIPMTICASVGTCVAYSLAIIWPQQVYTLLPGSTITHGWLASIQTSTTILGMLAAGFIFTYLQYHKYVLIFACVMLTTFAGAMSSVGPGETAKACALLTFACFGIGLIESASRSLLPLTCPDEDIGAALGVLGTIGYACAAVATAIYTTVLRTKLTAFLPPAIINAATAAGLPESSLTSLLTNYSTNITGVPDITPEIIQDVGVAIQNASSHAFQFVWYTAIAFGMCAIISSCFVINYHKYYTDQVSRKLMFGKRQDQAHTAELGSENGGGSQNEKTT